MSTETELARISQAKSDLKTAIEAKGVEVGDGRIDTYAGKVDQIAGITPTGTINITENGENIDVATYAKANVNVSGGGGDIPDQTFSVNTLATATQGSSSNVRTLDLSALALNKIYPYEMAYTTNTAAMFADFDSDGYYPIDVTATCGNKTKTMHFKSFVCPGSSEVYESSINNDTYLGGFPNTLLTSTGGAAPKVVDFDHPAFSSPIATTLTKSGSTSGTWTTRTGKVYIFPMEWKNAELESRDATYGSGWGHNIGENYTSGVIECPYPLGTTNSDGVAVLSNTTFVRLSQITSGAITVNDAVDYWTHSVILRITDAASGDDANGHHYFAVYIDDTVADPSSVIDTIKTYHFYQTPQYWLDDGTRKSHSGVTIQPQSTIDEWDDFVSMGFDGETTFTFASKSYVNEYALKATGTMSFKLSDIVSTAQPVTLNYTDTSTYTTTKHPAVVMSGDGFDISGLTNIYNQGGYY